MWNCNIITSIPVCQDQVIEPSIASKKLKKYIYFTISATGTTTLTEANLITGFNKNKI